MKIIDLLNKIANGEEVPREFTYNGYLWEYDVKNKMWFYYFGEGNNRRFDRLFYINQILNDEVEILEEEKKIPKKLFFTHISNYNDQSVVNNNFNNYFKKTQETINQLIDYLKSKGE